MLPVYCLSLCLSAYTFRHTLTSCSWCGGRCSAPRATSVSRELQAGLVQVWGMFWEQKPDAAVGRDQKAGLGLVGVTEHQCAALLWPKSLCWGPATPVLSSQLHWMSVEAELPGWKWSFFFFFLLYVWSTDVLTSHVAYSAVASATKSPKWRFFLCHSWIPLDFCASPSFIG